jgi:hypothetical protein
MPTYDYYCEANGQMVEVIHRISETMNTWGELCEKVGVEPGSTAVDAVVTRHITGGSFNNIKEKIKLTSILPK